MFSRVRCDCTFDIGRKSCNNLLVAGKKYRVWPTMTTQDEILAATCMDRTDIFVFLLSFFSCIIFGDFLLLFLLSRVFFILTFYFKFFDHLEGKLLLRVPLFGLKGMGIWKLDPTNSILVQFIDTRAWRRADKKQIKRMNKNNKV